MPSLEMSLGLRIRSKVNWLQNDKLLLCYLLTIIFMMTIKFTETIHDVLKIHVAFNTQPRQILSICQCKVKGHISHDQSMQCLCCIFCQYHTNPTM